MNQNQNFSHIPKIPSARHAGLCVLPTRHPRPVQTGWVVVHEVVTVLASCGVATRSTRSAGPSCEQPTEVSGCLKRGAFFLEPGVLACLCRQRAFLCVFPSASRKDEQKRPVDIIVRVLCNTLVEVPGMSCSIQCTGFDGTRHFDLEVFHSHTRRDGPSSAELLARNFSAHPTHTPPPT